MPDRLTSAGLSRRRFLSASALAVGGLAAPPLLSACDAGPSGSTSGAKTTKITAMYKSNELTKDHIAAFQKLNPDITVELVEFDQTRLNAMLSSGAPPDFVEGAAVGSANGNARGLAASLDPYLESSSVLKKDDLLPVNDSWRWDGKQIGAGPYYGITKDWSQDATLWYNTELFSKAGIAPLSATEAVTYDHLLDIARKLTVIKGGKAQVYGLGVEWSWNLFAPIATMILQQGGSIYSPDLTTCDVTTPQALKALQWYVDFAQAGVGPTSLNPLPDANGDLSTFMAKRMAISQDGFWYGGNFVKESAKVQSSIRMAPAPMLGDQRVSPCYAGHGAWIPAKSKNKDAAWKLMEFFMAGPPAEERAKSGWGLPALKSLMPKVPQDLPFQKQAFQTSQNELQYSKPLSASPYVQVDNWNIVLDKFLQQAIKKQITVEVAGQQITEAVNKLMKQGKDQIG